MSATTAPQSIRSRHLVPSTRILLLAVALVAAVAGAFAIGHSTANRTTRVVHQVVVPSVPAPANTSSCSNRVGIPC